MLNFGVVLAGEFFVNLVVLFCCHNDTCHYFCPSFISLPSIREQNTPEFSKRSPGFLKCLEFSLL